MNTISNAIGIKGTPGKIVLRIAENYHLGEPFEISERDLLKVEHGEQVHYGFIFGNGLIYNFLDAYYNSGNPSPWVGFTTLVRGALSGVIGGSFAKQLMSPFKARVTVDGEVWERREFKAVLASSIEQLGLALGLLRAAVRRLASSICWRSSGRLRGSSCSCHVPEWANS